MTITNVLFDTAAPAGSKLDPEVAAEIEHLAPGLAPGEVTEGTIADDAVTGDKIAPGAVDGPNIAAGGIQSANYGAGSVDTAALAPDSVTDEKAGPGVMTAHDAAGNPIEADTVFISLANYSLLDPPNPNTTYMIY